ncbi:glycosyl hydrolase family 18 protein [Microbulbifer sp. VAAC004]|uniref:glycosyl hydrolase family 18 protein n=1 Tax=unclassified Microbulbifer TaxID=2619833 RepID=UPI00403A6EBF
MFSFLQFQDRTGMLEGGRNERGLGFKKVATLAAAFLLSANVSAQETKRVSAYWADWEYWADSSFTHDNVDFSKLTHVQYAFAWNDEEGTIYFTDPYVFYGMGAQSFSGGAGNGPVKCSPPFWHPYSQYDASKQDAVCQSWNDHESGFVKSVHDDGAKAILSVGGWTLSHKVSEMMESANTRAAFIENAVTLLTDWDFDGLDLDFEYPGYAANGGRSIDKENFTTLLKELRARFDEVEAETGKRLELTAAVACGPSIAQEGYDFAEVGATLDYVNLMTYDFGGDWDSVAQHTSPLYPYAGQVNEGFDADSCRNMWMTEGNIPSEKIILGMSHYGRSVAGATAIGEAASGQDVAHWGSDTETRYYQIVEKMQSDASFQTAYDPEAVTHYGWFPDGGFISFEDTTSIAERSRYVVEKDLGGVMIWQLRGGMLRENNQYQYPLLDAALEVFGQGGSSSGDDDDNGDTGSTGDTGDTGNTGDTGGTGDTGDTGDSGNTGNTGDTGDSGSTGNSACEAFEQPYAGDPGYAVGDVVVFEGVAYESTHAPNWWSPSAAPSLWSETTCQTSGGDSGNDSGTGSDDNSGTNNGSGDNTDNGSGDNTDGNSDGNNGDEGSADSCPVFQQPYAGDASYEVGDKVTFEGQVYVSTFGPNWWSPAAAPQYWEASSCQ